MEVQIQELRPAPLSVTIGDKSYRLRPFNLDDEVWAINRFGSTNKMGELAAMPSEENPFVIFEALWHLLADRPEWPNYEAFIKDLTSHGKGFLIKASQAGFNALKLSLANSAPLVKNPERMKVLHRQAQAQGASPVCYARYYDTIARRYGFTLDQFYNLTLRQLHLLLRASQDGDYQALEVQAALAGRKLQPRMEYYDDVTPEQEKDQEAHGPGRAHPSHAGVPGKEGN
ncbi:MAG: hypothetical protein HC841_03345 [Verrucomicrobiae bacterium]|nr:hypothetical protein [Verrucomicrobiae bacterium]